MELGFLNPLLDRPGPWASVYFDNSPADQSADARRELSAREACRELAEQGADEATCHAVYDALAGLDPSAEPVGRAVFATRGEVVLDPPLSAPPQGPLASWSPLPHLSPLLDLAGENPLCLVAYVSRTGADFELRGARGSEDAGGARGAAWPVHRTTSADWSERHFQFKVENTWEHNAAEIAHELVSRQQESRADLLVLVGDPRERRAVHDRLPEDLRAITVESEHGGRAAGASSPLLDEDLRLARRDHLRRYTDDTLERFQAGLSPRNVQEAAVAGVPALVEAAREHRIASLLVWPDGPDLEHEVWVGAEPDQLAVRRTDARYLGAREPVVARADDALIRSAAATGADVIPVHGAEKGSPDSPGGGMGALLRWSEPG